MAENKTQATDQSVDAFINSIEDEKKRKDSQQVVDMMREAMAVPPQMWGESIVGFGNRHYKYETGREGDTFIMGFAPRKQYLTLYVLPYELDEGTADLLGKLGKHKTGKSCLYIKKLDDVDLGVLKELIERSAAQ